LAGELSLVGRLAWVCMASRNVCVTSSCTSASGELCLAKFLWVVDFFARGTNAPVSNKERLDFPFKSWLPYCSYFLLISIGWIFYKRWVATPVSPVPFDFTTFIGYFVTPSEYN